MRNFKNKIKGFTLVELLGVIVVLGVIMILVVPSVIDIIFSSQKNTFIDYVDKIYTIAQTKLTQAEEDEENGLEICRIYRVKNELGLDETGDYDGYLLVDSYGEDELETNNTYITLYDNDYMVIDYNYKGTIKHSNIENNVDISNKIDLQKMCNNSYCGECKAKDDSDEDITIISKYNLSIANDAHSKVSINQTEIEYNRYITFDAEPTTGYYISGITCSPETGYLSNENTFGMNLVSKTTYKIKNNAYVGDGSCDVISTARSFKVTFDANGGNVDSASKAVRYDGKYGELATATRVGYSFKGWYTSASGGTKITKNTKVTITAPQTLYAHWAVCTSGNYCDGTEPDESVCPTGYTSEAGAKSINECFINVAKNKYLKKVGDSSATSCATGYYKEAHKVYYGGTSKCSKDTTPPVCGTVTGDSTTWTNSNRTISVACSDNETACTSSSFSNTFTKDKTIDTITIEDEGGNTTDCDVNVYIDKTNPTFSFGSITDKTKSETTVKVTCSDSGSGISSGTETYKLTGKSKTVSGTCKDKAGNTKTYSNKYAYSEDKVCGFKSYKTCADPDCGYATCEDSSCGVASYKSCCIKYYMNTNDYTVKKTEKTSYNYTKCNANDKNSTYSGTKLATYTNWERNKLCGVASYNSCAKKACGYATCETANCGTNYNTCWHTTD